MNRLSVIRRLRRNIYVNLLIFFIALFACGTVGMWVFERKVNPNFSNLWQSFWSSVVYLLSGFEDRIPVTVGGRLFSLLIFMGGIFILGSVAGNFASVFIKRQEIRMPKNISDHIVICNWNEGGDKVIKEVHSKVAEPGTEIVVISEEEINEEELRTSNEYENVYFVNSDPTIHDVLKDAGVDRAKSIVILADRNSPDPDAKSVMISLAVNHLYGKADYRPHVVAEAMDHRKIEHLRNAGVDEIICASDFGFGIIAQCALTGKLSEAYQQLLSYTGNTNELYIIPYDKIPKKDDNSSILDGKTFKEALNLFNSSRDEKNPVILIGVKRGDTVILNPMKNWNGDEKNKFTAFEKGDGIVVMAFEMPDLTGMNVT